MRKRYLEGKYAINTNIPIPKIYELENHAYISPIDAICDIMGHGLPVDERRATNYTTQQISKISESQRAAEMPREPSRDATENHRDDIEREPPKPQRCQYSHRERPPRATERQ